MRLQFVRKPIGILTVVYNVEGIAQDAFFFKEHDGYLVNLSILWPPGYRSVAKQWVIWLINQSSHLMIAWL